MRLFTSAAVAASVLFVLLLSRSAAAESSQYQRPGAKSKAVQATADSAAATKATDAKSADAKASDAKPAGDPNSDKVDISDIEKKYWAPKDTDFTVVQNRLFSKAHRYSLTLGYGMTVNDSYNEGDNYELIGNYYWSERYGVQLTYIDTISIDNKLTSAFRAENGVMPDYNKATGFYGAAFNWVPFYAKMSFLNSRIMYFDLSLSPGIGQTQYNQLMVDGSKSVNALTYTLDVTQQLFIDRTLAFRFDFQNHWYNESRLKYQTRPGGATGGTEVSQDFNHTIILLFGMTLFY